jgi:RNA polymerase sigma-70 factor (ECF subfamily)
MLNDQLAKTDADLLHDLAEGVETALSVIIDRYKDPLFRFILRYTGSPSDAEDILQDTFVSIYTKASTYDPAWKSSTWIYRIALNKCRDQARKKRLRRLVSLDQFGRGADGALLLPLEIPDPGASPEEITSQRQALANLSRAMDTLPHKLRTALVLSSIENRPQAECAEILGVSRKSVEMLVYRARNALREKLDLTD